MALPFNPRWVILPEALLQSWLQQDGDLHTKAAAWVFEVPEDAVTREQRQQSKVALFSRIYGRPLHTHQKEK